jgi:hypothetical protein
MEVWAKTAQKLAYFVQLVIQAHHQPGGQPGPAAGDRWGEFS